MIVALILNPKTRCAAERVVPLPRACPRKSQPDNSQWTAPRSSPFASAQHHRDQDDPGGALGRAAFHHGGCFEMDPDAPVACDESRRDYRCDLARSLNLITCKKRAVAQDSKLLRNRFGAITGR